MSSKYDNTKESIIRTGTLEDILGVRKIQANTWLEIYPNEKVGVSRKWIEEYTQKWFKPKNLEGSREYFKGVFGNPDHYYRVASEGKEIVGQIHVSLVDGNQQFGSIYIDKKMRGTGLAQKMIDGAFEWLDLTKPIALEVASYNKRAIEFYRKNGFEVVEGSEHVFDDRIPTINMVRKGDEK